MFLFFPLTLNLNVKEELKAALPKYQEMLQRALRPPHLQPPVPPPMVPGMPIGTPYVPLPHGMPVSTTAVPFMQMPQPSKC